MSRSRCSGRAVFSNDSIRASRFSMISSSTLKISCRWRRCWLLQLLDLLLDLVLLFERDRLARLAPQRLDLLLGVRERLLGRQHHVVGPLLQLLARLVEVDAVLFERAADGGLGVPLRLGVQGVAARRPGSPSSPSTRPEQPKSFSIVSWSSEAPSRRSRRRAGTPRARRTRPRGA